MINARRWAVLFAFGIVATSSPAWAEMNLKDSDRIVFFGDASMSRSTFSFALEQFLRVRYPELKANIISLGKRRSTSEDGNQRLALEVLPLKPTCVVLCFGLEDGQNKAFDDALLDKYVAEMSKMMDTISEAGAQTIVLTPPPPEESRRQSLSFANYDDVVAEYAKAVTDLAAERKVPVLDWYGAVKKHREELGNAARQQMTEHGIVPSGLSVAIATDLLLTHWQADPFEFLITVDWKTGTVEASTGTASMLKRTDASVVLGLADIPVPPVMFDRGFAPEAAWPMCKWCGYKLKIANLPAGGAIISDDKGENAKPFLLEQLVSGADLSTIGPLASHETTAALMSLIGMKLRQVQKYGTVCRQEMPYPEFAEAYALFREAERALALAYHQVVLGTPTTLKTTVRIESVTKAEATPKKPPPKKAIKRAKRKPKP